MPSNSIFSFLTPHPNWILILTDKIKTLILTGILGVLGLVAWLTIRSLTMQKEQDKMQKTNEALKKTTDELGAHVENITTSNQELKDTMKVVEDKVAQAETNFYANSNRLRRGT